jgi:hypothetical protein
MIAFATTLGVYHMLKKKYKLPSEYYLLIVLLFIWAYGDFIPRLAFFCIGCLSGFMLATKIRKYNIVDIASTRFQQWLTNLSLWRYRKRIVS